MAFFAILSAYAHFNKISCNWFQTLDKIVNLARTLCVHRDDFSKVSEDRNELLLYRRTVARGRVLRGTYLLSQNIDVTPG